MKATIITVATMGLIAGAALGQNETSVVAPGTPGTNLYGNWGGTDADLWDNGPHDGLNGLSDATDIPFGFRRTLLMDFVIPSGDTWNIDGLVWRHVHNTLPPGSGTDLEIRFYDDATNAPGTPVTTIVTTTSYAEVATGNVVFNRPEAESTAVFPAQTLSAGRYWTDATIVGPENNFWLTAAVIDNPCWVDYADFGGLQPGINVFGVDYDIMGLMQGTSGGGGFSLSVTMPNGCPGPITVGWSGSPGNGQQALVLGNQQGTFTIPGQQPCPGTILDIQGGIQLVDPPGFFDNGGGSGSLNGNVRNQGVCGKWLQLVKGGTCETSNVAQIN